MKTIEFTLQNIPKNSFLESDTSGKTIENKNLSIELKQQNLSDLKTTAGAEPIFSEEILEEIQSYIHKSSSVSNEQSVVPKTGLKTDEKPVETFELKSETTNLNNSTPLDQVVNMDILSESASKIGESLTNDIKMISSTGEKLNDLAKETEKTLMEVPKNVIDYVKITVGLEKEEKDNLFDDADEIKEDATKELQKQLTDSKLSNEMSNDSPIQNVGSNEASGNDTMKQNNETGEIDESKNDVDNVIKFVNNGVEVGSSSSIIQAMNDEINEMSNDVESKSDELTMNYDGIINNELTTAKKSISSKMFEMKNGKIWKENQMLCCFCAFFFKLKKN